jgi:hypothetical protein
MNTRTQLLLGAAAIGALLTGAAAQTMRDEAPRAGQSRSQQGQPQQVDRIQDTNRQRSEPQNAQPQAAQPAPSNAQPQQQGQNQSQQAPRTVYPKTQTGQNPPGQQPAQGSNQGSAQSNQSGTQPSQSQPQQPSATTNQQPSAATNQPPTGRANTPSRQPAQSAQPQQSAPAQPQQARPAQRPAQQTTQSGQRSSSGVVSLNAQQQTQIGRTIARSNVRPLTNVNFSISVGTRVPSSVQLRALSSDLVAFVPQYRGYSYFVVEEQIVIVEPATHEIVTIIPYAGSKATASRRDTMTSRPVKLNTEQRDVVRQHATERRATSSTTVRKRYVPGDRIDREVTIESFPETVYTEVPSIRRYRYFRDDDDVFLVNPDEDRVVDVIR